MRFWITVGLVAFLAAPLAADNWMLQSGPEACEAIPLEPVQPVGAWKGLYSDGTDQVCVYVTDSKFFFPPDLPEVRILGNSGWTAVGVFPKAWKTDRRKAWLDRWTADFQVLASLPSPGWPVLFPSVLRKG